MNESIDQNDQSTPNHSDKSENHNLTSPEAKPNLSSDEVKLLKLRERQKKLEAKIEQSKQKEQQKKQDSLISFLKKHALLDVPIEQWESKISEVKQALKV